MFKLAPFSVQSVILTWNIINAMWIAYNFCKYFSQANALGVLNKNERYGMRRDIQIFFGIKYIQLALLLFMAVLLFILHKHSDI